MLREMRWDVLVALFASGCGGKSADGGVDGSGVDGSGSDGPTGMLSAEPSDPVSAPCAGTLGFPSLPSVPSRAPQEIAFADVDGDGILDLAYKSGPEFGLARGLGNGRFAPPSEITITMNGFFTFTVGDANGDGHPDLVYGVKNGTTGELRVALNNGNGTFATPQSYATQNNFIEQVELVDLDADGKRDVVGLVTGGGVVVFANTGNGFGAVQPYPSASNSSYDLAVGDVSGDGKPDIVRSFLGAPGRIYVIVNSGTGTFGDPITYPAPDPAWGVALADFDEDGKRDVALATQPASGAQLAVLPNLSPAGFGTATTVALGTSYAPRSLVTADVDGDGHLDVGITNELEGTASLVRGTGTGGLGTPLPFGTTFSSSMAFADLNGDARLDMAISNLGSTTMYLNNGTPSLFETRAMHRFETTTNTYGRVRLLDLDADHRLDLLWLDVNFASTTPVKARLQLANGSFASPVTFSPSFVSYRAVTADLDNDARTDVVLLGNSGVQPMMNGGNGGLTGTAIVPVMGSELAVADVDGNGFRDVIVGRIVGSPPQLASEVQFVPGLGSGTFGAPKLIWSGGGFTSLALGDLDHDGDQDLIVSAVQDSARRNEVAVNNGNGTFQTPAITTGNDVPARALSMRDFNGDGKLDLTGYGNGTVVVRLGNGDGTFAAPLSSSAYKETLESYELAFADFNGDGKLDVLSSDRARMSVLLGRGDGTFEPPRFYDGGARPLTFDVGDINDDGQVDILATDELDRVSVLFGRCIP